MKNQSVRFIIEVIITVGVVAYFAVGYYLGISHQPGTLWIKSSQLESWIRNKQPLIIDLREENESRDFPFAHNELIHKPFLSVVEKLDSLNLPRNKPLLFICSDGNRSRLVATLLHEKGFDSYYLLDGMLRFEQLVKQKNQSQ